MNEEKKLEEALRDSADRVFQDDSPEHLEDRVLEAFIENQSPLSAKAQHHLSECTECRSVVAALLEARAEQSAQVIPFWRRAALPILAVAAAVLFAVVVQQPQPKVAPPPSGLHSKGPSPKLKAEVTMLAIQKGQRRDIRSGDTMMLSEKIGFKYGNPLSEVQTLTLLGWDGSALHWYYPESPEGAPHRLKQGALAMGVRLPFDIHLQDKHKLGTLVVAAAFDSDPKAIAKTLRSGTLMESKKVKLFRYSIIAKKNATP